MWRVIDIQNRHDGEHDYDVMCMHAVHRSRGQVIDISIEYLGSDILLLYIARKYVIVLLPQFYDFFLTTVYKHTIR